MTRIINCAFFTASLAVVLVAVGCKKNESHTAPTLTTNSVTNLSFNTATSGGTITANGGATITASGICWSKANNSPTIGTDSFTTGTTTSGSFTSIIANLVANTTYYVRAYATNSAGTGYGNVVTFATTVDTTKVIFTYNGQSVTYGIIISPTTGRRWLDRNLGAGRVATYASDSLANGDLFQWGRVADGHQIITSDTTSVLSTTDVPSNSKYILSFSTTPPNDWRNPSNDNLWQGSHGINNPCPTGWHVPFISEWAAEKGIIDSTSGYAQLKLTAASGSRSLKSAMSSIGGFYWSATPVTVSANAYVFYIVGAVANAASSSQRGRGYSVRCIKD